MTSKPVVRLRKFFISLFILANLWVMIATNASLALPTIAPSVYSPDRDETIIYRASWYIGRTDWWLNHLGWIVGLKNYWRMFSPVDRFNWYMVFSAVHVDGEETKLPLANQIKRNFWQRNFTDFREAKFHLNIYNAATAQKYYAQYLCRKYQNQGNPISAIKIELKSQNILSPDQAKMRGVYLEPRIDSREWGRFEC